MPDNLEARGPQDRTRVNIHEPWEVRYWTQKWSISEDELRAAVAEAGVSTKAVAEHLGKASQD